MEKTTGYTKSGGANTRSGETVPLHEFVCIGMRRYVDDRGVLCRVRKLWKISDVINDIAYWRNTRENKSRFVPMCRLSNVI